MGAEKSHVTMEQHHCVACGTDYDTGSILLDKRLRQQFDRHTITGNGICPDCDVYAQRGYVFALECKDNTQSDPKPTGTGMWIKREAMTSMFTVPVAPKHKFIFIEESAMKKLVAEYIKAVGSVPPHLQDDTQ